MSELREQKKLKLFLLLHERPMRWTEIIKTVKVTRSSLSRYMEEFLAEGCVKKKIDKNGHVVYEAQSYPKIAKKDLLKGFRKKLERLKKLQKLGLFKDGITDKELLEFFSKIDFPIRHEREFIRKSKKFTLYHLMLLNGMLLSLLYDPQLPIEIKIKADKKAEEILSRMEKAISKLK